MIQGIPRCQCKKIYRARARIPKPTAAAPVKTLALAAIAAPVEEPAFAVLELVGEVGVALAPEAELAAEVEFPIGSPTLLQIACEYASAFVRSEPLHSASIQVVVLLMKASLAQRQWLSSWLQPPKLALARQVTAQDGSD